MRGWSRSCVHFVLEAKAGKCQTVALRASEPICKSIDGHSRRAGVRWAVGIALEVYQHTLKWSAMLSDATEVFKGAEVRLNWSDKVYWQVADTRRRASEGEISSRSTQLGKEDFCIVVIVPIWID